MYSYNINATNAPLHLEHKYESPISLENKTKKLQKNILPENIKSPTWQADAIKKINKNISCLEISNMHDKEMPM